MQFTTVSATSDLGSNGNVAVNLSAALRKLDEAVKAEITKSWKPSGSVSIAQIGTSIVVVQALTK